MLSSLTSPLETMEREKRNLSYCDYKRGLRASKKKRERKKEPIRGKRKIAGVVRSFV